MNKANLLELHQHVMDVRLWSSIKKVASRASHDRPNSFHLPSESLPSEVSRHPSQYPLVSHDPITQEHGEKGKLADMEKHLKEEDSFPSVQSGKSSGE